MKYLLDVSAVAAMLKGDVSTIHQLGMRTRDEIGIPHPVVVHLTERFAKLDPNAWPGALVHSRWDRARELLLRCPWSEEVSAELAALRRTYPDAAELDRMIAAHAVAHGAAVVTGTAAARARFARFSGLAVEHWGRDEEHGKNPVSP